MSRVHTLLDTIIRLQRRSQTEISDQSGVHASNLSKYLNGETDIRSSSMIALLQTVGVDLEQILELEMDKLVGKQKNESMGEALETLLGETDAVSAKTILESLSKRIKNSQKRQVAAALSVVNNYKAKLKIVRRHA